MAPKEKLHKRLQFALPSRYRGLPIETPHYVEPHLDGFRAALVFRGTVGSAVSLLGRTIPSAYRVINEIERSSLVEDIVFDGEFLCTPENNLASVVSSTVALPDAGLTFYAYDVMTLSQWDDKICEMPLHYRKSILAEILLRGAFARTLFAPSVFCSGLPAILSAKGRLKSEGYKAAIYKDIDAPYPFGNTLDWLVDKV